MKIEKVGDCEMIITEACPSGIFYVVHPDDRDEVIKAINLFENTLRFLTKTTLFDVKRDK